MAGFLRLVVLATLATACGFSFAQSYPSKPIRLIIDFPAGGPSDSLARILSGPLEAALGQPIVIENVGGAGGTVGVGRAARAEPDGYTLLIGQWSTQVVNPATYKLDYDIVDSFAPVALLAETPAEIRPIFLPLAIVRADLTRLSRADNDPFVPHFRSRFSTLWVTWRASRSTLFKGNR